MAKNLTNAWNGSKNGLGIVAAGAFLLLAAPEARADDATVTVGQRFAAPPREGVTRPLPLATDQGEEPEGALRPELGRSAFRLAVGPSGITTGKSFGFGVGLAADFGSGSVGGRLAAAWLRGEGKNADGTSTPTGDAIGQYTGELTLDLRKRGPVHPIIGVGVGVLHVSRSDASGYAGIGTGRLGVEYALGLDDADVRVGGGITGGLVGPVDSDVKDLRAYALVGVQLAIGF